MRDMTKRQFKDALARNGFKSEGFMGYYDLGVDGQRCAVCIFNAGTNRRAQLAYLLRERDKVEKQTGVPQ